MNVALSSFNPISSTTTTTTTTTTVTSLLNPMPSTLSNSDRSFVEFTRCLYKVKSVVQELEAFSKAVAPTLSLSPYAQEQQYDPRISTDEFIKHVNQYLEESFRKFNHMCKVLLIVLSKLEASQPVRKERIDSFRQEVINEWRKAINVRQSLLILVHKDQLQHQQQQEPSFIDESDDESSETSLEPTSSESS